MNVASSSSTTAAAVRFHSCRFFLHPFSSSSSSKVLIPSYWGRSWWRSSHMQSISSSALFTTNTAASGSSSPVTTGEDEVDVVKPKPIEKPQPWLVVGLGNPGKMYNRTRHNVGFEMVDAIAEAEGISMGSVSFRSLFGKGCIGDTPVMLAKPQTFMNCSGESVGALVSYYKIPVKQVLLIYDDLDLPFAKLRLLPRGGHGGHNGHWEATRENGCCQLCSSTIQQTRT